MDWGTVLTEVVAGLILAALLGGAALAMRRLRGLRAKLGIDAADWELLGAVFMWVGMFALIGGIPLTGLIASIDDGNAIGVYVSLGFFLFFLGAFVYVGATLWSQRKP